VARAEGFLALPLTRSAIDDLLDAVTPCNHRWQRSRSGSFFPMQPM
jgi:hypothetical protein